MDRTRWRRSYSRISGFKCPMCNEAGTLLVGDVQLYQTTPSRLAGVTGSLKEGSSGGRFTAHLGCAICEEVAIIAGDYLREGREGIDEWSKNTIIIKDDTFFIRSFQPAPHMISVPAALNDGAAHHLKKAFELFWNDYASCANRLRIVVEHLLDQFGISRTGVNGKYVDLNFRIGEMTKVRPDQADFLNALRWLGNAGSHDGKVDFDDLIQCFDMLEHVLTELFGDARAAMRAEAQRIIAARGKPKP